MAKRGPEGKFRKKVFDRLPLKAALAAITIANAAPAMSQSPTTTQPHIETADKGESLDVRRVRKAFEGQSRYVAFMRRMYGDDDPILKHEVRSLEETRPYLADARYIRGLLAIEAKGGDLSMTVGTLHPSIAMDEHRLSRLLSRIPDEIVGRYKMAPADLDEAPSYSYDRPGIVDLAHEFSENGVRLTGEQLNQVLDIEQTVPVLKAALMRFQSEGGNALSVSQILKYMQEGYFEPAATNENSFVDGVIALSREGIQLTDITRRPDEEFRDKIVSAVADPNYRSFLKTLGVSRQIYDTLAVDPSLYGSPSYLKNLQTALDLKLPFMSQRLNDSTMARGGLAELLIAAGKYLADDAYKAAKLYGDDEELFSRAIDVTLRRKDDPLFLELYYLLDPDRIKNARYMELVEAHMQNAQVRNKFAKIVEKLLIDAQYAKEKTGLEPKEMTVHQYRAAVHADPDDPILRYVLSIYKGRILRRPVLRMNELHNGSDAERLDQLSGIDAATLLDMMVIGGPDAYLSTFLLMYNGKGGTGPETKKNHLYRKSVNNTVPCLNFSGL